MDVLTSSYTVATLQHRLQRMSRVVYIIANKPCLF